ncbi:putative membrane protein [Propionispora sp. 2/2-37]|uniref:hypothetical protein n=1 Tax=Propionispora sp. 2/2-37 TaxID=1677858 RepID=UPI0006BB6331|nr:hypothetical protein [Propionispora sp. 2/2-37]CUH97356.1 putative membrane protein [Propionispora sp. 2/2-37]
MNCNDLNKLILFALALVAISDVLLFFIELRNQRYEKEAEAERAGREDSLVSEMKEIQKELTLLKEQIRALDI